MPFENIVEKVTEQLYADERLRSNLTDDEATVVLDWAAQWIKGQVAAASDEPDAKRVVERALTLVLPVIKAINAYAARGGEWRVSDALVALEPASKQDQAFPQTQVVELLTALASAREHTPSG